MSDMHEAGFVHRDLKPANVMWLPRENRWTVIDFGCAALIGAPAPISFTLAYAAPEVVHAFEMGLKTIESTPALDAWSLGVMAFELLTGSPAFRLVTDGRKKVRFQVVAAQLGRLSVSWHILKCIAALRTHDVFAFHWGFFSRFGHLGDVWLQVLDQIRGDALLPWEGALSRKQERGLGAFKGLVLQLLHRDPEMRVSMKSFHAACIHLFSGRTTTDASGSQ
jgi:serine/threonine protein kinase